jgi:hypothetical protein
LWAAGALGIVVAAGIGEYVAHSSDDAPQRSSSVELTTTTQDTPSSVPRPAIAGTTLSPKPVPKRTTPKIKHPTAPVPVKVQIQPQKPQLSPEQRCVAGLPDKVKAGVLTAAPVTQETVARLAPVFDRYHIGYAVMPGGKENPTASQIKAFTSSELIRSLFTTNKNAGWFTVTASGSNEAQHIADMIRAKAKAIHDGKFSESRLNAAVLDSLQDRHLGACVVKANVSYDQ